jgi:SAM-dependent methyltransferase
VADGYPALTPRATLRWAVAKDMVRRLQPATILEVGCGLGALGARLSQYGRYTAVERDEASFEVARGRIEPRGGTIVLGDHRTAPAPGTYDLLCAFEVLEHQADDEKTLAEWAELVRPGGHLLVSVPAGPHRFGPWDALVGHYRRYSEPQLRAVMSDAGLRVTQLRHYEWPVGYLLEFGRNRIARGQMPEAEESMSSRTNASGRMAQPRRRLIGSAIELAMAPFVVLQDAMPGRGTGLVALAQRPELVAGPADRQPRTEVP